MDRLVTPVVGGQPVTREDLAFTVPPLGSLRVDAVVRGPVTAQVFAATPLGAVVGGGAAVPGASAMAETPLLDSVMIPILENRAAGVGTGILIANSVAQSRIKLTLFGMDGQERDGELFFGMKEVDLPPYGHRVLFVSDLFPNLGDFQGAMTIDGGDDDGRAQEGGPISVAVLERGAGGRIALSPAVPMIPLIKSQPVHVAGLSSTAATRSLLMNPSPAGPAQGTLRFFDEAGRPWSVSVNGKPAATTAPLDISSTASEVFTVAATGPAQRGTARAETTQGVVAAVLRAASVGGNVLRVPPSDVWSGFISAVRRDRPGNVTTRFSLSSTGDAVTLRLMLRSASGTPVTGGAAEIRLAANGHTTRTIEQLFPSAAIDVFEGTVTVIAEGGMVAATVLQIDPASPHSTALPVKALP